MLIFQDIVICAWIPIVLLLFASLPPRRAALIAIIGAWLFLPNGINYSLGSQNLGFNKITITGSSALFAALLFDAHRVFSFRPRWADIPMFVWCLCPIATSLSTGHGIYDGLSVAALQTVMWGVPYFLGRVYFTDLAALRDLAIGLLLGGMIYAPLCWMEMRMGTPGYWHELIYGQVAFSYYEGWRMGGVRPMIFMSNGLMLALWMAATAMVAFWLWVTHSLRLIFGIPLAWVAAILIFTEYRCVSTGALAIFLILSTSLLIVRWRPLRILVILLLLLVPTYMTLRITKIWDGSHLVDAASAYDPGRSASLDARRQQEDDNIALGKTNLAFGVGTWESYGADQLWVLAFRNHGMVGLTSMTLGLLFPVLMMWRAYPVRDWKNPVVAPAAVLAFVVLMFLMDGLFNYMFNPIYILAAGGLMSLRSPAAIRAKKRSQQQRVLVNRAMMTPGRAPARRAAPRQHNHLLPTPHGNLMNLLIIPPLQIHQAPSGRCVLTCKFLEGVAEYQKHWPGRIAVACEPATGPDSNLDHVEVDPRDLPFDLHVVSFNDTVALSRLLLAADVILATLVPRQIMLSPLFKLSAKPVVYVTEFSLQTRRQIIRVEVANPLKRMVRLRRENHHEANFNAMLHDSAGVQCNGTPTYEAYKNISPNPLLYFDTRVTREMLVSETILQQRLGELQGGGPLRLAFSGRLIAVKGADHLPLVAAALRRRNIPFVMEIFGGGDMESALHAQIQNLSLQNSVHLRGNIDFATRLVPHISRNVDIFVCCHRQGDPSCTYLETLSCGTPIAGYDNEAFAGVALASNAGWSVPLDNPDVLAETIVHLHQNRAEIAAAAHNALAFAQVQTFEVTMTRRVEHLLQCAGKSKAPKVVGAPA